MEAVDHFQAAFGVTRGRTGADSFEANNLPMSDEQLTMSLLALKAIDERVSRPDLIYRLYAHQKERLIRLLQQDLMYRAHLVMTVPTRSALANLKLRTGQCHSIIINQANWELHLWPEHASAPSYEAAGLRKMACGRQVVSGKHSHRGLWRNPGGHSLCRGCKFHEIRFEETEDYVDYPIFDSAYLPLFNRILADNIMLWLRQEYLLPLVPDLTHAGHAIIDCWKHALLVTTSEMLHGNENLIERVLVGHWHHIPRIMQNPHIADDSIRCSQRAELLGPHFSKSDWQSILIAPLDSGLYPQKKPLFHEESLPYQILAHLQRI